MKLELLVIVNKNVTVNCFPGLVHTARHAMEFLLLEKLANIVNITVKNKLGWSRNKVAVGEPVAGK